MKKYTLLIAVTFLLIKPVCCQVSNAVTWSAEVNRVSPTTAVLSIKADIVPGWHLYSQYVNRGSFIRTCFSFLQRASYTVVGEVVEPKSTIGYDPLFKVETRYFERSVIFEQTIRLNQKSALVKGNVRFTASDGKQCLPPEQVDFIIPVK